MYQVGLQEGAPCVNGSQSGGVIRVAGKNAFVFCRETYQRLQ